MLLQVIHSPRLPFSCYSAILPQATNHFRLFYVRQRKLLSCLNAVRWSYLKTAKQYPNLYAQQMLTEIILLIIIHRQQKIDQCPNSHGWSWLISTFPFQNRHEGKVENKQKTSISFLVCDVEGAHISCIAFNKRMPK